MDVPPNDQDRTSSETVEFGGLPFGLPFAETRPLQRLRTRLAPRSAGRVAIAAALISLALGLIIGFVAGHLTAHPASKRHSTASRSVVIWPQFLTTVISATGARCAVQVGRTLQLGIELINESRSQITLGRISATFPISGLRAISGSIGACGALPGLVQPYIPMPPASTEWIVVTVAVHVACPQAYPVWFKVAYSAGGKNSEVVITGFPDLGQVRYDHCATALAENGLYPNAEIVDPASGRSYGG
jgi:hypothetical protein